MSIAWIAASLVAGCGASAGSAGLSQGPIGGITPQGSGAKGDGAGSSGGSTSSSTGSTGSTGSALGASSGGVSDMSSSGGAGTGGAAPTVLQGSLAFGVGDTGLFYGQLPDGGADLSNLDCRLSDGTDLAATCDGYSAADGDGGLLRASRRVVDIYVTSLVGNALTNGDTAVEGPLAASTDGGGDTFATIELTEIDRPSGTVVILQAQSGSVSFEASPSGMSGSFTATFGLDGGLGTLSGDFSGNYCGSLTGY